MNKQNNKSKEERYQPLKTGKRNLFVGGFIVLFITATPFIFYSYRNFPSDTQVWETSFFSIETAFQSVNTYIWFLLSKIVPLYLLLLWFFTCKHWWHWIILVPIAMYAFQLWGIFNESQGLDELEIYYVLPLMLIIVPAVYLIRARLFAKIRGNDLQSFEEELSQSRSLWKQIKDLFN